MSGRAARLAGIAIERTRAIEALQERERRFRALIENVQEAITLLNADGTVRYVSPAFERITGFTAGERAGRSAFERVHLDDVEAADTEYRRLIATPGSLVRIEPRIQHKDGSWRTIELVGQNLLHDPAVQGIVVTYRDVTEQRRLEEQFRQAQKMEAVGRLAGGVAHDFNNLLNVIGGNADLALLALPDGSPVREDLEEIVTASERAASLTQQLLAFSRRQVLQPSLIDPAEEVQKTIKMLRRVIGEDIELVTLVRSSGRTLADPGQMSQVLMNLAVNARDAMPQGGTLTIETRDAELTEAEVRSFPYPVQAGQYVEISVRDTGCGMDPETLAHAFEPFFTTKEVGQGTGLGLATVYGIVKQSGGYIWVDSVPDQGTTFQIYLPRVEAQPVDDAPREAAPATTKRETILVVEDEAAVRKVTRRSLERSGYRVLEAAEAEEALRLAHDPGGRIDLVLTDVVMPGLSGAELVGRLMESHPGLRIVYMSGYTDDQVVRHGVLEEQTHFLQKPFKPDQLARMVREALDQK